jgi:hypothetical protein
MDWFHDIVRNGVLVPVVAIVGGFAILAIIQWRKYREAGMEATLQEQVLDLKHKMIEKGLSADEIERVLNAQPINASQAVPKDRRPLQDTADYKG